MEIQDGRVTRGSAESGRQTFDVVFEHARPVQEAARLLTGLEELVCEIEGGGMRATLSRLKASCTDYERTFLARLARGEELRLDELLNLWDALGLEQQGGKTAGGVTSSVTRKADRLGLDGLYQKDWDRNMRVWRIGEDYRDLMQEVLSDVRLP